MYVHSSDLLGARINNCEVITSDGISATSKSKGVAPRDVVWEAFERIADVDRKTDPVNCKCLYCSLTGSQARVEKLRCVNM